MADGIHAFTVTDHQTSPLEELIVSWIAGEISELMIAPTFLTCIQNLISNASFYVIYHIFIL